MDLESHVVVIDSRTYYGAGAGQQNRQYYFDWSVIPDGKYELSFTFVSDSNQLDQFVQYTLFSNMISPQNVYQAGSRIGANSVAYLGTLALQAVNNGTTQTNNLFKMGLTDNAPVICNRPMTNIFTIGVYDGLSGNLAPLFTDYMLTLYFRPLRFGLA